MKLAEFLMERCAAAQKRRQLEGEVAGLQSILEKEQRVGQILQCALRRPPVPRTSTFLLLPLQIQVLLIELEMVEQEIIFLEKKVEDVQISLYQEKKQVKRWKRKLKEQYALEDKLQHVSATLIGHNELEAFEDHLCDKKDALRSQQILNTATTSMDSSSERSEKLEMLCYSEQRNELSRLDQGDLLESPNKISEELIMCLINIFHKLHQSSNRGASQLLPIASKLGISCMSSNNSQYRSSSKCKLPVNPSDGTIPMLDLYSIVPDTNETARANGPYKKFIQFMEDSLDASRISQCHRDIRQLMVILNKLSSLDINFLTYKQRLAFWINIYNACIMQAFLLHGVPPSEDKLLTLLNKAAINVGGIILNALAIEHFVLRHQDNQTKEDTNDKEALLRHTFGLGYPEPDITFALCRGSWSSPALRVYTQYDIVDELERAKVEYLEDSIVITSKKKIILPKLLHCHMRDFADDMESLLEWIYSQLPREGSLKRLIMECITLDQRFRKKVSVEIRPYESKFCYLLPI